jgi:hypothetical protein
MVHRMWINQPSTHQPLHHMHGERVLAEGDVHGYRTVYLLSGQVISMRIPAETLSEGWPNHLRGAKHNAEQ